MFFPLFVIERSQNGAERRQLFCVTLYFRSNNAQSRKDGRHEALCERNEIVVAGAENFDEEEQEDEEFRDSLGSNIANNSWYRVSGMFI